MSKIWVRLKNHPTKQVYIDETEFNEEKYIRQTEEEKEQEKIKSSFNIKDICESRSAPGMFLKTDDSRGSIMHHDKLDDGAIGDLLDKGLDSAKKRAVSRNKKKGSSFKKVKRRLRKKKNI